MNIVHDLTATKLAVNQMIRKKFSNRRTDWNVQHRPDQTQKSFSQLPDQSITFHIRSVWRNVQTLFTYWSGKKVQTFHWMEWLISNLSFISFPLLQYIFIIVKISNFYVNSTCAFDVSLAFSFWFNNEFFQFKSENYSCRERLMITIAVHVAVKCSTSSVWWSYQWAV